MTTALITATAALCCLMYWGNPMDLYKIEWRVEADMFEVKKKCWLFFYRGVSWHKTLTEAQRAVLDRLIKDRDRLIRKRDGKA